jgi:hypothetical protein
MTTSSPRKPLVALGWAGLGLAALASLPIANHVILGTDIREILIAAVTAIGVGLVVLGLGAWWMMAHARPDIVHADPLKFWIVTDEADWNLGEQLQNEFEHRHLDSRLALIDETLSELSPAGVSVKRPLRGDVFIVWIGGSHQHDLRFLQSFTSAVYVKKSLPHGLHAGAPGNGFFAAVVDMQRNLTKSVDEIISIARQKQG